MYIGKAPTRRYSTPRAWPWGCGIQLEIFQSITRYVLGSFPWVLSRLLKTRINFTAIIRAPQHEWQATRYQFKLNAWLYIHIGKYSSMIVLINPWSTRLLHYGRQTVVSITFPSTNSERFSWTIWFWFGRQGCGPVFFGVSFMSTAIGPNYTQHITSM